VGATAVLLYQRRISSTAAERAEDARSEQALLRKSFDALQFKLQIMQSNFEVAIADCEDLRAMNREQSRKVAELARQSTTGAGPETS
jgi:hypothetical protein